jgi:hypothetical protein
METYIQFVLAPLGIGCVIWSAISYIRINRFLRECIETRGEVIRLERSTGSAEFGGTDYAPVFQFQTASGESITVTSDVAGTPAGFTVGQSVRVRYDPTKPSDAKIHTFFQTWGGCVIPAWVGLFFLGFVVAHMHSVSR